MSGVEFIIGTTLASIPLALEAYDRSGRVFDVFKTIKRFPKAVTLFEARLSSQRTIFRNNAINLLTALTQDRSKVEQVLRQPSSRNHGLSLAPCFQLRVESLFESFETCLKVTELINDTLEGLCVQFEAVHDEVDQGLKTMTPAQWLRHAKTRVSLALSKPKIEKSIAELRDYNSDFDIIGRHVRSSLQVITESIAGRRNLSIRRPIPELNMLNKYHRVRAASNALYSTLEVRWACSSHTHHIFDLKVLDPDLSRAQEAPTSAMHSFITCQISVDYDDCTDATSTPLRLEIEQACEMYGVDEDDDFDRDVQDKSLHSLMQVLEIRAKTSTRGKQTTSTKQCKINPPVAPTPRGYTTQKIQQPLVQIELSTLPRDTTLHQSLTEATAALDLSLVDDLCHKSQELGSACSASRALFGQWQSPHARWFTMPPSPRTACRSLNDMVSWIAGDPVLRSLPRVNLVELALDVAEGLMNFYSTPWLNEKLGETIRYMCQPAVSHGDATTELALIGTTHDWEGPFFMMCPRDKGKTPVREVHKTESFGSPYVRNQLLYSYGILLLEFGYGKPWEQLKTAALANDHLPISATSEYYAAEKLAIQLVRHMGPKFPRIIRKCLACDFGLGETDLDNEDLQRQFVEDVVLVLRQLQVSMQQFDLSL